MESKLIDWHPADIIAGLRKKGTSMAAESRKNGLSSSTLANALTRPWPKGELIIARALGTDPWVIWPSRYHDAKTHEFIDRTRILSCNPRPTELGVTRDVDDYSPFTRSMFAPSARSLSSMRS